MNPQAVFREEKKKKEMSRSKQQPSSAPDTPGNDGQELPESLKRGGGVHEGSWGTASYNRCPLPGLEIDLLVGRGQLWKCRGVGVVLWVRVGGTAKFRGCPPPLIWEHRARELRMTDWYTAAAI